MRFAFIGLVLGLSGALCAFEAPQDGYELHEWGVFPVVPSAGWANCDMKAEWAALPKFMYRLWPEQRLPYNGPVLKPVIFFHTQKAQEVKLEVRFAEGRPLVWWPGAVSPVNEGGALSPQKLDRLNFDFYLLEANPNWHPRAAPNLHEVPKGHWFDNLRDVHAARIYAAVDHSRNGLSVEAEDFAYYDGLMKAPPPATAARDGAKVKLSTNAPFALLDTIALERDGKILRIAKNWIARVEPGAQNSGIEWEEIPEAQQAQRIEALQAELLKRLEAAGLTGPEALSLVKTWAPGLFQRQGLQVIARVPQETYEAWLPLKADPAPVKLVRVGLLLFPHLEPEREARMEALIKQLSSDEFEKRDAAQKALSEYGGAAFDVLEKHLKDADAETAKSCQHILDELDTRPALKPAEKTGR